MENKKLIIITSHPIQYYAPLFKFLAREIPIKVLYCHNPSSEERGELGFNKKIEWDTNLLEGYEYEFLKNTSKNPSITHFWGCKNPEIGNKIKENKATHVLIFGWYLYSFWQAYFYCLKDKIPVGVRGDSYLMNDSGLKSKIKKLLYPLFLKRYDAVFYVGKNNYDYLRYYGVDQSNMYFAPHAVDQEQWEFKSERDSSEIKFLWVGKMMDLKHPHDAIAAFLKSENTNNALTMIGDGPLFEELKSKYSKISNIHFEGFINQSELSKYYHSHHCLLLTSDSETWGLVVNEAFACGIPAIISDMCGCAPDLIDEGTTGFTYETHSISDLSEKMDKVYSILTKNPFFFNSHLIQKNKMYHFEKVKIAVEKWINQNY